MQIRRYENEQYAGMHDQSFDFRSGMNVVLGDNETGKSTMIAGIYDTLLQPGKLNRRTVQDVAFIEARFPTTGSGVIDGKVRMEANGSEVTVSKEWSTDNKNSRTSVSVDGRKEVGDTAEAVLNKQLNFGKAIYDNIIFGRQSNETAILNWLYSFMDTSDKKSSDTVIGEAREKISGAISAAGGINEERFLEKLNGMIDGLSGNWDTARDCPMGNRGLSNPWKRNVGGVLQAYYNYESAKDELKKIKSQLADTQNKEQELQKAKAQRTQYRQEQKKLNEQKGASEKLKNLKLQIAGKKADAERFAEIIRKWPEALKEKQTVQRLLKERNEAANRNEKTRLEAELHRAELIQAEINALIAKTAGLELLPEEATNAVALTDGIRQLTMRLNNAKLRTNIRMLSEVPIEMTSASGERIRITEDTCQNINGFVKLLIPGIAEITVAPQELDVEAVQAEIAEKQEKLSGFLRKYGADDADGLKKRREQYQEDCRELESQRKQLALISVDELREKLSAVAVNPETELRPNLQREITDYLTQCRAGSLEARDGALEHTLAEYETYGTVDLLSEKCRKLQMDIDALQTEISLLPQDLMDADELKKQDDYYSSGIDKLNQQIEQISKSIVNCDDIDLEALEQTAAIQEDAFRKKKKTLAYYERIREDFKAVRTKESKYGDFFRVFNEYLTLVTGGVLEASEGESLQTHGMPMPSAELLSRGTKQTVLLAFRLALLSFYFPEDGGMVVLDDVLLDMDPTRREKAVLLLKTFAEKHQVIFTTCDPSIAELLGGHLIRL